MKQIVLCLLALSSLLMAVAFQFEQTSQLAGFLQFYADLTAAQLKLAAQLYAGLHYLLAGLALFALRWPQLLRYLVLLLLILAVPPLLSLLGPKAYIADLGGFPVLGSGQGIIKYWALLMLAVSLWRWELAGAKEKFWLNYLPVALVLLWIGGLKFMAFEAKGIVDLVSTSPLLSWLYWFADEQQASNLIGIYDWTAFVLLGLGFIWPRLFWPGFLLSFAVFATTQSFLLTFEGAWLRSGVLSGSGVFIIKDLWFIANMAVIYQAWCLRRAGR